MSNDKKPAQPQKPVQPTQNQQQSSPQPKTKPTEMMYVQDSADKIIQHKNKK